VMYTGFDEGGLATSALELGAAGFIEKSTPIASLADQLAAIRFDVAPDAVPGVEPDTVGNTVLQDHLERFREVFHEAAIGMATMTLTGRIVRANKALAELVGHQVGELVGTPYSAVAPDSDRVAITEALHAAQDGEGTVVRVEHAVLKAPPSRRLLTTAAPVRDARGRPLYLFIQSQDVSAQRRIEEELRQSEQRFRLLVEAVEDYAIFMLDPDGRVISWNAGAQRIKGYSSQDIVGRHFRVFYPRDMQVIGHPEHELELARSRGRYEEEGWRVRKDGSRFWASVVITAIHDHDGRHLGFAKVTRDIDERRQMLIDAENAAQALATANDELEAANSRLAREAADQAQFLAVTAHELRAPVGALAGSAKLLVQHLEQLTHDERAELSESMTASAARLQRLLSDLLMAARLESKAVHLEVRDVDLSDVLARTVAAARAAVPDVQIELAAPPGLHVLGEADRLAQAVDNLLNNAVRHGRSPVLVRADVLGDRIDIAVSDRGPGVSADVVDRLFDRFATGSPTGGTGLGLFIVRELARAHGGDARYEPNEGGSARFVLSLPVFGSPAS
jgi:PAS domain S-box-containing protein